MSNMNEGVEAFRAKLESLGAKISESTLVSTSWKNTVLIQTSLPLFGFPPMDQILDFSKATPNTDLDYDIHQYTSKGKIAGFDHDLDINVISSLKTKKKPLENPLFKTLKAFV